MSPGSGGLESVANYDPQNAYFQTLRPMAKQMLLVAARLQDA